MRKWCEKLFIGGVAHVMLFVLYLTGETRPNGWEEDDAERRGR